MRLLKTKWREIWCKAISYVLIFKRRFIARITLGIRSIWRINSLDYLLNYLLLILPIRQKEVSKSKWNSEAQKNLIFQSDWLSLWQFTVHLKTVISLAEPYKSTWQGKGKQARLFDHDVLLDWILCSKNVASLSLLGIMFRSVTIISKVITRKKLQVSFSRI